MRRSVLGAAFLALSVLPPAWPETRLSGRPDSLTTVLGLDLEKEGLEELPGAAVAEYRLYTGPERTALAWRLGDVLYLYPVAGERHREQGLELLATLRQNNLLTFVAVREGGRLRQFTPSRQVVAIQLAGRARQ